MQSPAVKVSNGVDILCDSHLLTGFWISVIQPAHFSYNLQQMFFSLGGMRVKPLAGDPYGCMNYHINKLSGIYSIFFIQYHMLGSNV